MNIILFDEPAIRTNLLPLTFTRPVAAIRIGILTIKEKWEKYCDKKISFHTVAYLSIKFPVKYTPDADNVWVNGAILPTRELIEEIKALIPGQVLIKGDTRIAINTGNNNEFPEHFLKNNFKIIETGCEFTQINKLWDIFSKNDVALRADYDLLTSDRKSAPVSKTNQLINKGAIFIEEGAKVECCILNAENGPIYIGKEAEVMEGSSIRGPFALGEHATLKLGTKIYGATTIGPHSKVGGEVNNSVIFGFSNKAHDGFLGNAVIGEWCNLGADSNNSNLKNNYGIVKLWNYEKNDYVSTGLTFCGLIMGDHSKCGINTMFNTGTVVGVNSNIFGTGFPPTYIPSFTWGGVENSSVYKLQKAIEVATRVFERRGLLFDEKEKQIFTQIYILTHGEVEQQVE